MNKKNLRYWELRLGVLQIVALVGVLTGSVVCAFALGYFSGQKVGFESAMASSVANVARIPVAVEREEKAAGDDVISEVYARLGERAGSGLADAPALARGSNGSKESSIPEVGTIKGIGEAPLNIEIPEKVAEAKAAAAAHKNQEPAVAVEDGDGIVADTDGSAAPEEASKSGPVIRVLGDVTGGAAGKPASKTESAPLGALIPNRVEKKEALKAKSTDEALGAADEKKPVIVAKTQQSAVLPPAEKVESLPGRQVPASENVASAASTIKQPPAGALGIGKGWFAQVAAPRKRSDADQLAGRLKSSGFRVTIENAQVRGEEYYRVLVGPEDSRQQAERLVSQLSRESYLQGAPFIRMVK